MYLLVCIHIHIWLYISSIDSYQHSSLGQKFSYTVYYSVLTVQLFWRVYQFILILCNYAYVKQKTVLVPFKQKNDSDSIGIFIVINTDHPF